MERSGSLLTLTLRGSHSDILSAVQTYDPVFAEVLPLTLEEIFISETEAAGYDIKDFLYLTYTRGHTAQRMARRPFRRPVISFNACLHTDLP